MKRAASLMAVKLTFSSPEPTILIFPSLSGLEAGKLVSTIIV
jgi:hypothetical protein